jgi:hypothetical protein
MKYETIHLETLRNSLTLAQTGDGGGSGQGVRSGAQQRAYDKPQVVILGDAVTLVQAVKLKRIDSNGSLPGAVP